MPIRIVGAQTGGSMAKKWDPDLHDSAGNSFYAETIDFVLRAGRTFKGIVWYQGESDAVTLEDAPLYEEVFPRFIDRLRTDLGDPQLPVVLVQIARVVSGIRHGSPLQAERDTGDRSWEIVRDAQRRIASTRTDLHMVSAIDLPLDDPIHLNWEGQRRMGKRLAEIALTRVYGLQGHATPIELDSIEMIENSKGKSSIRVRFSGVNGSLQCPGRPVGFELRLPASMERGPVIYHTQIDPDDPTSVVLLTTGPVVEPVSLVHGAGMNPYVNIVDDMDIPIPAFGPIKIPL
jgi:sialate O-acetylesterase